MLLNKRIPLRYIFAKVRYELVYIVLIGLATNLLTITFHQALPEMPLTIPAFLGTSISVLLSFKLNQSYERWWEARKVWGAIVNDSRSLVLQLQSFAGPESREQIKAIAYRQIAWCYALGRALRGNNVMENLEQFLPANELSQLEDKPHKPLAILQLTNEELAQLHRHDKISIYGKMQVDSTLVRLCDSMGKAERINSTVFPATYRFFLHFAIYLFVISLSIGLKDVPIYFEIPLLVLLSMCFFLLEKSALFLQDPFRNRPSDTPVTAIARTIEINLRQLIGEKDLPAPFPDQGFYLL